MMGDAIGGSALLCPGRTTMLCLFLLGLSLPGAAAAAVINVPSQQSTVRLAVAAAATGDTILVAPGTHNGGAFIANKSLTIASHYIMTGDTAMVAQTVLSGVVGSVCGGASGCLGNAVLEFGTNAHGSAVIGLTLTNGENGVVSYSIVDVTRCRIFATGDGVDYYAGSGGTIRNSVFENNTDDGVDLNGRMNITVKDNIIRNNSDDGIECRLYGFMGPAVSIDIIGNRITGNREDGIQLIDYPEVSDYVIRIERNFFSNNFDGSGLSAAIGVMPNGETVENLAGAANTERVYVINNTFLGEKNGLVGGANVVALNNVFSGIEGKALRRVGGSSITSYSLFWNNGINYEQSIVDLPNLLFANPLLSAGGDPAPGSPVIDSGTATYQWLGQTVLSAPPISYAGSAPDMGAIEFGLGPPPANGVPLVNAGPDQSFMLATGATLYGIASDDGLPNPPGAIVTNWSVVSGPGPMVIEDPSLLETRAVFSTSGVYLLRLIASDGASTAADTVRITVLSGPNTAPVVGEGSNQTITLPASAMLDGTVSDDGLPNPPGAVATTWSVVSGPGGATIQNATLVDTQASFTLPGDYVLRLTADDGALSANASALITVLPSLPPFDRRITAASDDTEEEAAGNISGNTSDIELVLGATTQTVGLRFTNLAIPQGTIIANAYIQFEADEVQTGATSLTYRAHATDNPATFTTASFNVSSRPRTTAAVTWAPPPWTVVGEAGVNQRTPDLKAVIQEIVNRPGWSSGNALAIIVTGTGHRTARAFETTAAGAALLHIELGSPPPPVNLAPVVDAGPDRSFTLPADAVLDGTVSDDGLPNPPGAPTTTWSVVSGPGAVVFGDATLVDTPITITTVGTYRLRLTANDGALSASDSMQVIVSSVANTAPVVSAGPNQTITLPSPAALDGTVSDDGLPNPPGALTTTWSTVSGPGVVTFTNANLVDTQATFTVAGTYVLRLTANDGALSTNATVQITVLPVPNTAPVVSAGPNQTITLPATAALDGTVSDDGLPNPPGALTTTWSVVSGPGVVTFTNANLVDTQATITVAGTYVLRLTANDGALSTNATVQITVLPAPVPIDRRIAIGSDDAEESVTGFPNLSSADLELVFDTSLQTVGLRFTNLTIAPGATITKAYIQFEADEAQSEVTNLTLRAQAADNAATFTTGNLSVSSRPRTTGSASWTPPPWAVVGEAGANQRTSELKTMIQEVVNRPGWVSGNALAIIITGTGHRTARAFEGSAAGAALLHIEAGAPLPAPNTAPVVSAGSNQTITLPAGAALDGTVSDDGLPNPPGALTTTWSTASGPGVVTFTNANLVDTQATFAMAGTYVLRLTANDGVLSTNATVQITVLPVVNVAPTVIAGPDQSIVRPAAAVLDGTVSDDGLPNPPGALTTTWSTVSGPGVVTFTNANLVDTQATFTVVGTYVLRLTANDGALSTSDSIQIIVLPVPNTAPVVSAGPNQSITLPATAALDGTVSDDGLPNPPGTLTTTWSTVSGPGSVTFTNANLVDTQASFAMAGTYVLRLTANDGALSTSDSIQIIVLPVPNTAPVVSAGPNQTITLPATAALDGTVSDDGLPNPPGALTTTWSTVSGPGAVTFTNANLVDTQASFAMAGTYVLRLTANDGALNTNATVQITVLPDPNVAPVVNAGPDRTIVLPAAAALDGTVSDDGLPNPPGALTTTWSVVSGPGAVTFTNANLVDTQATFTLPGVYVLRLTANDTRLSTADLVQVTAQAVAAPLEKRVAASADDAEESSSGSMNLNSTNLDLVFNASNQTVGLRFTGLAIPVGATVTRAYVQFTARKVDQLGASLTVQGQAADNPGTFIGTSGNLSGRTRTTASVAWSPPAWGRIGDAGVGERTPELKTIVQEIVARPGWSSGSALVIIITGSGVRVASSYDANAAEAALLHVEYATAGASEPAMAASFVWDAVDATAGLQAAEPVVESPRDVFALHRVGPNPARGALQAEFSLAVDGPASLVLLDIAGRRIAAHDVGRFGPGRHRFEFREPLPSGVYLMRLAQGASVRTVRVAVLR